MTAKLEKHNDGWFKRGTRWVRIVELPAEGGKRKQRWVSGRTQADVRAKVQALTAAVETGTYVPPSKLTVASSGSTVTKTTDVEPPSSSVTVTVTSPGAKSATPSSDQAPIPLG